MWRVSNQEDWIKFGKTLALPGGAITVCKAREMKTCSRCKDGIGLDQHVVTYRQAGRRGTIYCKGCSPLRVIIQPPLSRRPQPMLPATAGPHNSWLTVWSLESWREFLRAGADTYGLPAAYEERVRDFKVGDRLICYMRGEGLSQFFAVLEVASEPFYDTTEIWSAAAYPVRVRVRSVLRPSQAIKYREIHKRLSLYRRLREPDNHKCWGNHFHQSIRLWPERDADTVVNALARIAQREARRRDRGPRKAAKPAAARFAA